MDKVKNIVAVALLASAVAMPAFAQDSDDWKKVNFSGSIMSDVLYQPDTDSKIGLNSVEDHPLTNTYIDLNARSKYVDAGLRFSFLEYPLPGFENDFKGWGLPYYYVNLHMKNAELTLGHFYDQFGSGFIFRAYEERSLGIDNSIHGARLALKPVDGVNFKALTGKQRRYWDLNDSWITGADFEFNIDQWAKSMAEHNTYLTLGASWVNKHESDEVIENTADLNYRLNLPTNVNAFDVRANLQTGDFGFLAEYAWKTQDPSYDNGYIYRQGNVAMLSASWSKSGISALVQAKRSDNMQFRSKRSMRGTSSMINHLPAFTMDQTYSLAALYPYATNPNGEWAYQAELGYKFKKGTALGGKYGTGIKVNFSYVNSIKKEEIGGMGSDGYSSDFFAWGDEKYYHDLNVQIDKRVTKDFKLNFMYMNQYYNKTAVEGHGGIVKSNIFIAEGKYKINKKLTLRGEVQYLSTKDDEGDWWFGLLELSLLPNWMFTISDQYNSGLTNLHYYQGFVTFNKNSHRVQLGYGRTRAGFNCSGGVCRYVPASKGFTLSYNYNF